MKNPFSSWFDWLQKDAPTGRVERYPELTERGETSLPGVFVVGDLTGIPLLKLAAAGGHEFVAGLCDDPDFQRRRSSRPDGAVDLLVVGAGPAGVAAALTARDHGLQFRIVDSGSPFQTIVDFPKAKPIFAEPADRPPVGPVQIHSGSKEELLANLVRTVDETGLQVETASRVERLHRDGPVVVAELANGTKIHALAIALAIGKSGDPRKLGVSGDDLPHVSNRLFDPGAHSGEDILVVGGGDSAVEAAIALAESGNRVTLSARKASLTRPKEENLDRLSQLATAGKIHLRLGTSVDRFEADHANLSGDDGPRDVRATAAYVLIGREMPLAFFRRSGIRMEGEWPLGRKLLCALSVLLAGVIYFGKAMPADWVHSPSDGWSTYEHILGIGGWGSFALLAPTLIALAWFRARKGRVTGASAWQTFKWIYFGAAFTFFCSVFFGSRYFGLDLLGRTPGFWYGFVYCVTVTVFGVRRVKVRPTAYIRAQTSTLVAIQWVFLWLLPEILVPWAGTTGHLGGPEGFWLTQVFPPGWDGNPEYWRAYGFILAWPLFIWNLYTSEPTTFWLIASIVQTAILIPLGIRYFGKGVYCGWICSCGGLAETLGDEYRTLAPHGPVAKRWENAGQVVLLFAIVMTGLKLGGFGLAEPLSQVYTVVVDIIFAGVLGIGVYFFMSGRVWCRFLCPLAALMHVYTKFTRYRIFSRKKRCISCNVCTKSCHMGIDVMNYAVRGKPMDDVQCVRCSACVVNCPTDVLSFGRLDNDGGFVPDTLHATRFPPVDWDVSADEVGADACTKS